MRQDDKEEITYLYVYNYQPGATNMLEDEAIGESFTVEISADCVGKPYQLNAWTGVVTELGAYAVADGRTTVTLTLAPGEATLIAFDTSDGAADALHAVASDGDAVIEDGKLYVKAYDSTSYAVELSDGTAVTAEASVQDDIVLGSWDLTIETWTAGELVTRTEAKPEYAHTTTEYKYETVKEEVSFEGLEQLASWADLGVALSGVGTYTTSFELPADWDETNGAVLRLGSIYRNGAVVFVNGTRLALPLESLSLDITDYVVPGQTNELVVEVETNLQNSVKGEMLAGMGALQKYGLVGENVIDIYRLVPVE